MAQRVNSPTKIFYRIGEVARQLEVEPHTLRYWETQFQVVRPKKSANGQRVYQRSDLQKLRRIRSLLYEEGYTIAGVKKRLRQEGVDWLSRPGSTGEVIEKPTLASIPSKAEVSSDEPRRADASSEAGSALLETGSAQPRPLPSSALQLSLPEQHGGDLAETSGAVAVDREFLVELRSDLVHELAELEKLVGE
ncbi:MAG: MerR family transcriptional regulator [Polyangiaceae bacterium]|nr:MerR family transcriptional regulator [Polyangiaceae bacterium]